MPLLTIIHTLDLLLLSIYIFRGGGCILAKSAYSMQQTGLYLIWPDFFRLQPTKDLVVFSALWLWLFSNSN